MTTSDKNINIAHAQSLLEKLKKDFISEFPERCNHIEDLVLRFDGNRDSHQIYDELYRRVHSLKGTAGTYGFHSVTKICHYFEDLLSSYNNEDDASTHYMSNEFTDICLEYIDLIKHEMALGQEHDSNTTQKSAEELDSNLSRIHNKAFSHALFGLLIPGAKLISKICHDTLKQFPIKLTVAEDGYAGLGQLLHKKYDFLVVGNKLKLLDGFAVIAALRTSDSRNKNIPIIMITSDGTTTMDYTYLPDRVIRKDKDIVQNLSIAMQEIMNAENVVMRGSAA